jgi:GT2 family glycosyltransferase
MAYPIFDIEVTRPLPSISIPPNDSGMAILLRRKGKPIDFWMQPLPGNSNLNYVDLTRQVKGEVIARLIGESIREELFPKTKQIRLPSLTVAICTRDHPDQLRRCLESLEQLQSPTVGTLPFKEILVVDNAPFNGKTKQLVVSVPKVRYVCEPRPGLNFARNKALREAAGDLLAYVDDDVTVDGHWLDGLMEAWVENPDAVAFTGLVLPYELETEAQIMFERRGGFGRGFDKIRYGRSLPGNSIYPCGAGIFGAGANMAFQREILLNLGGFDDALDTGAPLPGGGDLDIFYRVIRAGYPLAYEPRYMVFHQHRREMKALRRQYWRSWGFGFMAFVVKSFKTDPSQRAKIIRLIIWWSLHQMRHLAKSLQNQDPLPPNMILAEFSGGLFGLFGAYQRSVKRIEKIKKQFIDGKEASF